MSVLYRPSEKESCRKHGQYDYKMCRYTFDIHIAPSFFCPLFLTAAEIPLTNTVYRASCPKKATFTAIE